MTVPNLKEAGPIVGLTTGQLDRSMTLKVIQARAQQSARNREPKVKREADHIQMHSINW